MKVAERECGVEENSLSTGVGSFYKVIERYRVRGDTYHAMWGQGPGSDSREAWQRGVGKGAVGGMGRAWKLVLGFVVPVEVSIV